MADRDPNPGPRPSVTIERGESAIDSDPNEPPIVARMVVEIRSDGTRTIARGAMEDAHSGERVGVVARGSTPMALAASLAKSIFSAPMLARGAIQGLLKRGSKGS